MSPYSIIVVAQFILSIKYVPKKKTIMKIAPIFIASAALVAFSPVHAQDTGKKVKPVTTIDFPLTVTTGAATCLPNARGTVIDHTTGETETLTVSVKLAAETGFRPFHHSSSE